MCFKEILGKNVCWFVVDLGFVQSANPSDEFKANRRKG